MPPAPSFCSSLYWPICWASISAFWASRRSRATITVKTKIAIELRASRANKSPERPLQNREGPKCFGVFDLRGDAHVGVGQPLPGAGDFNAAIVAIAVDVDARVAGDGVGGHAGQRQIVSARGRAVPLGHVAARIADQELQDRVRILLVGQQTEQNQRVVEAAVGNEQAVLVEGIRLTRVADAAQLQNPSEFLLGPNAKREDADDLKAFVANRRGDVHRRHAGADAAIFILQGHGAGKWRRNAGIAGEGSCEEGVVLGNVLLSDQLARRGGNNSLRFVGDEIADVVVGRERGSQRFCRAGVVAV